MQYEFKEEQKFSLLIPHCVTGDFGMRWINQLSSLRSSKSNQQNIPSEEINRFYFFRTSELWSIILWRLYWTHFRTLIRKYKCLDFSIITKSTQAVVFSGRTAGCTQGTDGIMIFTYDKLLCLYKNVHMYVCV